MGVSGATRELVQRVVLRLYYPRAREARQKSAMILSPRPQRIKRELIILSSYGKVGIKS